MVNYETLLHTSESTTSTIAFSIARPANHPPERVDFRLSDEAEAGLERIKDILHDDKGTYWTVCDITIPMGDITSNSVMAIPTGCPAIFTTHDSTDISRTTLQRRTGHRRTRGAPNTGLNDG